MWNKSSAKPCTRILFLQLLLGVLLLGGVFLLAVNEDIAATQRTMVNTVNYVKEQCILLRLPARGLQHLPVLLLHVAEQRRRVRGNFLPAHAGVSGGVGHPAADGAGCGRSLVGSLCGGSAGVRRVDWLPVGSEGEIPLFR